MRAFRRLLSTAASHRSRNATSNPPEDSAAVMPGVVSGSTAQDWDAIDKEPPLSIRRVTIDDLQPELLAHIFAYIRAPPRIYNLFKRDFGPIFDSWKPLFLVMLVCRRWHDIVVHTASLWTEVDFPYQPRPAPHTLILSKAAPLHLRLEIGREEADVEEDYKSVLRDHAYRLHRLELIINNPGCTLEVVELLDNRMPRLRCLILDDVAQYGPLICKAICESSPASSLYPSLKALVLQHLLLLPRSPLSGLTHLHLSSLSGATVNTVVRSLVGTPALEVLQLHLCLHFKADSNDDGRNPSSTLILHNLHHITLASMDLDVAEDLLSRLGLPSLAVAVLHYYTSATSLSPPRSYHAKLDQMTRLKVGHSTSYHQPCVYAEFQGANAFGHSLAFATRNGVYNSLAPAWPLPIATLFPLSSMDLEICHLRFHDWDNLLPFVERLPECLHTIIIEQPWSYNVAFDASVPHYAKDMLVQVGKLLVQDDPVLCPNLKELWIHASSAPEDYYINEILQPALAKRNRDGHRVRLLRLSVCDPPDWRGPSSEVLTGLRNFVDEVTCLWTAGPVKGGDRPELWRADNEFWEGDGRFTLA